MRKKEKWLLFVMPSLVKMRLSRLVSRDNRIIYNVLPLPMPRAKRRAFQIVLPQKKLPHKLCSSLTDAGLIPQCGWRLPGRRWRRPPPGALPTAGWAGLGHGQHALHAEYGGAQPGALGAADAQVRVNECDHKICLLRMMSAASMGGFGAKYARHLRAAVV